MAASDYTDDDTALPALKLTGHTEDGRHMLPLTHERSRMQLTAKVRVDMAPEGARQGPR